jgi:hypothetical protein
VPLFQLVAGALGGCGGRGAAPAFRFVAWFYTTHWPGGPLPHYCGCLSIHVVNVRGKRALNGVSGLATSTSLTFVILHDCQVGRHVFLDSSVGWGHRAGCHYTALINRARRKVTHQPARCLFFLRNMAECGTQRFRPNCIAREWRIRKVAEQVADIPVPFAAPLWIIFGVGHF